MNNIYNTDITASRNVDKLQNQAGFNQNPYINQQMNIDTRGNNPVNQQANSTFTNGDFVKGALIGAAVTYLLTNKGAQESIFKAVSKGSELFQAGMEEMKERYEDARAQMEANEQ